MDQKELFKPIPVDKLSTFSKEELIILLRGEQQIRQQIEKEVDRLRASNNELEQKSFYIEEQYITIKNKYFGKSSEREPSENDRKKHLKKNKKMKKKVQLPSLRYPDAPLIEREVTLDNLPSCKCCGTEMSDSGMTENSEFLTAVPQQFFVIRQKRHKYRCGKCHGDIVTAPSPPRIKPGSSYSDEMMLDVALSKYCDLIPVERYSSIAGRAGLMDLPPQSLIGTTHNVADYVEGAYSKVKKEITIEKVLNADETPHRMLEDHGDKSWYLWGFSTRRSSYFEIHDTRSGDVASEILNKSKCEYLVSDVFSGYAKAVRVSNVYRKENKLPLLKNVYCNAHARRKFKEAAEKYTDEAQYFIEAYKKIYRLEKIAKARPPSRVLRVRRLMTKLFEEMKETAIENVAGYSSKSKIAIAMKYFLKNYEGLTLFIKNKELPIDNNSQERQMRSPVIGRKTWYGTHSKRGARTTAILFSLVESCKLNNVNPREYFKKLVEDLHKGKEPYTPKDYADL
ncbi:MAG: IS66 family transposase [Bdellovibrionaceae bacterium]|nr:IS66 family transposase [Pseudobdellovibrionaceae bacterium]MCB9026767.1 IS66 family transposase [Pseudobdellovibrionaceae bacterium]MCB9026892.1 IS66 family transposase [Pseudobdellovibrionaceae bacterium]